MRRTPAPSGEGPGRFVVLEGIDGSGKTTQARLLAQWLREAGRPVVETREPTGGKWGRLYRAWARGEHEAAADEVLRYFIEDRRQHCAERILPALAAGSVVVCDRYVASTLAYQTAHGVDRDALRERIRAEAFPEPDLALWLCLPVAEAVRRLGDAPGERFERAGFLERVDQEYRRLGLVTIDAAGPIDEVSRAICDRVESLLAAAGDA